MDATVIESVRKEEEELLRKLAAVQALLRAYDEQPSSVPIARPTAPNATLSRARDESRKAALHSADKRPIHGFTPYGREAIATVMSFLSGQNKPVRTRELVSSLERIGFTIRGENPINALGALLGRSVDVISHGKAGWTLADPDSAIEIVGEYAHKENEPPSVSAGGSDAAGEGAPPPDPAPIHSHWGHDA